MKIVPLNWTEPSPGRIWETATHNGDLYSIVTSGRGVFLYRNHAPAGLGTQFESVETAKDHVESINRGQQWINLVGGSDDDEF